MVCHVCIRLLTPTERHARHTVVAFGIVFHPLVRRFIVRSTKGALARKSLRGSIFLWEDSQEEEYANLSHIHVGHTVCLTFEMNNRGKECRQNMTRCPKLQQV